MIRRLPTVILALVLAVIVGAIATASAQESTPAPAKQIVSVGAWDYPIQSTEPVLVYVDAQGVNPEGSFVTPLIFLRTEDGYVPLTRCDDVTVRCVPETIRATGVFEKAHQGQTFSLKATP